MGACYVSEANAKPEKVKLNRQILEGFVGSCLIEYFDNPVPFKEFHRELWDLCCSDEQFIAVCAPRRHSKSTTVTICYTLAASLFRQSKYILIVSDTISQSVLFLGQIKQILEDSTKIQQLFGLQVDEKGLVYEKCTEDDIIIRFKDSADSFRICAKGSEQKLRGLLWNGTRPDLIICDDILNEELVANKDRRDKFRRWYYGALIPCRSKVGRLIMVGTPMNLDDVLESLMPKEHSKHTVVEDLKTYSVKKTGMWKTVKYRAHNSDYSAILWPEMHSEQSLKDLRAEMTEQGIPEVYSCEMLCNPVDDSIKYFRKNDFLPMTEDDRKKHKTYYITADLAISEKERADYTAIVVGGMDSNGQLHIVNCIRERLSGDEIVETLMTLQRIYDPVAIGIEDTQISKAIGPYLYRAMNETGTYMNLLMLKPHRQDKIQRARSIQARMRAGGVKFDKQADWWPIFENECLTFPRARHDDVVDGLAYQGILIDKMAEGMTQEEVKEKEYEDEVLETSDTNQGRSETTGY